MHYTNPEDCGYVREPIFGQDDFVARELDLGDDGGAQKRGGPGFHRFLSSQDEGLSDQVIIWHCPVMSCHANDMTATSRLEVPLEIAHSCKAPMGTGNNCAAQSANPACPC